MKSIRIALAMTGIILAPALITAQQNVLTTPPPRSAAYNDGLRDRASVETWMAGQSGEYQLGINYWASHRSVPREAVCLGSGARLDGCIAAKQKFDPLDARRKSEADYKVGWNSFQASDEASGDKQSINADDLHRASPSLGTIAYGNRLGEDASVITLTGAGTPSAILLARVGWDEKVHYCEAQGEGASCIATSKKIFTGPKLFTASANCLTKDFIDFEHRHLNYIGERSNNIKTSDDRPYKRDIIGYEGFELVANSYMDADTSAAEFIRMCPGARPTAIVLPELGDVPDCDNEEDARHAANLIVETGRAHLMNYRVVNIWNIISTSRAWNKSSCQAKAAFNTGDEGTIVYRIQPRHGHMMIEAHLE